MAQRTHKWCSVACCYPAADPYTIFVFADLFDILVFLVVTAAKAISPKPPKTETGTAICWGHDVIECEDCRETITWRSRCIE